MTSKPVLDFKDGQFLQINAAENEGLITVTAKVDMEVELLKDMHKNIQNDYVNAIAEKWNEQRVKIADHAARSILFEQTGKWLKETLRVAAMDYVSSMCRFMLEKKLNMAPFKPIQEDDEFMDDTPPKVMALSWGQGDRTSATHMVVVETNHRLNHSCVFAKLGDRDREADMEKFSDKVAIYEPDIIVLAGFHPGILTHLYNIVTEIVNKGRARKKFSKQIPIAIIDDDVARVFMNSKEGQKFYPDMHPMVRYLVSLARKVQDPIMEYSRLMNVEDDFKHLHLHPLQKLLPEDKLKRAMTRSFMTVIARCGIDINLCLDNEELRSALQFVSGLGPRKASAIISKLNRLVNQLDLIL